MNAAHHDGARGHPAARWAQPRRAYSAGFRSAREGVARALADRVRTATEGIIGTRRRSPRAAALHARTSWRYVEAPVTSLRRSPRSSDAAQALFASSSAFAGLSLVSSVGVIIAVIIAAARSEMVGRGASVSLAARCSDRLSDGPLVAASIVRSSGWLRATIRGWGRPALRPL